MNREQHTIQEIGTLKGVGIHTGKEVTISFLPAPPDHGIKFQRIDLPSQPTVDAIADYAVETQYHTRLDNGTASVSTIEHVLAALSGLEIDNILIQLDGSEVPILDGSAAPFVTVLKKIGLQNQHLTRKFFNIDDVIIHEETTPKRFYKILPSHEYELIVKMANTTPFFPSQSAYMINLKEFTEKIAPARTFIFVNEIESLYDQGLIQGGTIENTLIFSEEGYDAAVISQLEKKLNQSLQTAIICKHRDPKLRYANEPAKHKLLDLLGDLTLVGRAIKGHIIAENPGHVANVALAKKLRKLMLKQESQEIPQYHIHEKPVLDTQQLSKLLPHRYPFQLVDKIIHLDNNSVIGIKNVTINEPYFQGHFPGTPVMPGVLQIEALTQTAGTLILNKVQDPENYLTYFLGIDKCKFRKMVVPGDTLMLHCYLLTAIKYSKTATQIRSLAKIQGKAFVGKQLACEAVLFAQIVKEIA